MARVCPNCGVDVKDRSKFCPSCGATVAAGIAVEAVAAAPARTVDGESVTASVRPSGELRPSGRLEPRGFAPPTHGLIGANTQAGFGLRFGALLFDLLTMMILWMGATFALSALSNKSIVSSNSMLASVYTVAILLYLLNFVFLAGATGQSLGKRIVGIRIVRADGTPFRFGGAAYRHIVGYALSAAGAFLGFIWIVWDRRQQGWHDKLAHTNVVLIP